MFVNVAIVTVGDVEEAIPPFSTPLCEMSTLYYCGICGKVWARVHIYVTGGPDGGMNPSPHHSRWTAGHGICKECGDGSLLQWGVMHHRRDQELWTFGELLTMRELELAMSFAKRCFPAEYVAVREEINGLVSPYSVL